MATEENTKVLDNLYLFIYSLLSKSPHLIYDPEALGTKLQIFHEFIVSQFPEDTRGQRKLNQT